MNNRIENNCRSAGFLRLVTVFGYCLLCMFLFGCGKKQKTEERERSETLFRFGSETYTSDYVLYHPAGSSRPMYYYNAVDKEGGIFCFDSTCEHKESVWSEKGELIKQGCPAYDYSELAVYLTGDYMHYFSSNCLYRADRQGNNRKIITKLSKPYESPIVCCYTDEALYINYTFSYEYSLVENEDGDPVWRAGRLKEKPEAGILRIPYSGEGEKELYHTDSYYDAKIADIECRDGHIYFLVYGMDRPSSFVDMINDPDWADKVAEEQKHTYIEAYDYEISSGEMKQLFAPRQFVGCFYFSETYGFLDNNGTLELYHYDGGKATQPEISFWNVYPSAHDIIGWDNEKHEGVMVSEKTGKVVKRSSFTWEDFNLYLAMDDGYYGMVGSDMAYISAKDFWAGNKAGIVLLPGQN